MNPFVFVAVTKEGQALKAMHEHAPVNASATAGPAQFVAGGTTLFDLMKLGVENPAHVIDIHRLPLNKIERASHGGVRIGAMVSNTNLAYDKTIQDEYPALSQALLSGASPQLRNMATTGGNLLQRTRCTYFRDTSYPCNKRQPGAGCSALDGYNRAHAILGTSDQCIATHPSDMCVAMAAFDAVIVAKADSTERRIPIADFYIPYGEDPAKENTLRPGELIIAVELPAIPYAKKSTYLKVRDRASYEFALASAAVALDIQGGNIKEARIALGGIATKPWRSHEAEQSLQGQPANDASYKAAADAALQNAKPQRHNGFKIELARRTLIRALQNTAKIS